MFSGVQYGSVPLSMYQTSNHVPKIYTLEKATCNVSLRVSNPGTPKFFYFVRLNQLVQSTGTVPLVI